jgi:MFS family permease
VPADLPALALAVAVPITAALPIFLTAALAPLMAEAFSFGAGALGLTVALHYLVAALSSVVAGRFVAAVGIATAIHLTGLIAAATCLLMAVAGRSSAAVMAILLFAALGNGLAAPAASGVLRAAATRDGLAFGAQQAGGTLAPLAAGLALPLVAAPLGWRWAFGLAAAPALVVALTPAAVGVARVAGRGGAGTPGVAGRAPTLALSFAAGLASAAAMGTASFLVVYGVDEVGMADAAAGLVLAAVGITAAAGRIVLGAVADRPRSDPLAAVAAMLVISVAGYAMLIAGTRELVYAGAAVIGFAGWGWSGALAVALVRMLPDAPSAVGSMMTGTFGGAVAGPVLVGVLAEHDRWDVSWIVCAALAAAAGVTVAFAGRARARPTMRTWRSRN